MKNGAKNPAESAFLALKTLVPPFFGVTARAGASDGEDCVLTHSPFLEQYVVLDTVSGDVWQACEASGSYDDALRAIAEKSGAPRAVVEGWMATLMPAWLAQSEMSGPAAGMEQDERRPERADHVEPPMQFNLSLGASVVGVAFDNRRIHDHFHPFTSFSHTDDAAELVLTVNADADFYTLTDETSATSHYSAFTDMKSALCSAILRAIHPQAAPNAFIHGAMLSRPLGAHSALQGMLIFGDRGAGKSTLSALFHASGATILSDDICMIDRDGASYPSPFNVSIRHGAMETIAAHAPPITERPGAANRDDARYFEPVAADLAPYMSGLPVQICAQVRYLAGAQTRIERLPLAEGLRQFLTHAVLDEDAGNLDAFAGWIGKALHFDITYSDFDDLRRALRELNGLG